MTFRVDWVFFIKDQSVQPFRNFSPVLIHHPFCTVFILSFIHSFIHSPWRTRADCVRMKYLGIQELLMPLASSPGRCGVAPDFIDQSAHQSASLLGKLTSACVCCLLQELLTHTSLETHKLDLMAEISSLKLKLAAAEKDRRELDERCRSAQVSGRARNAMGGLLCG